jgi:hypothetical protein
MYFWWMIIGFQVVWFACAWGISHQYPLLPLLLSLVYLNTFMSKQSDKKAAYLFLGKFLILGFIVDSLMGALGLMTFMSSYPQPLEWVQPWWLSFIWLCFAASAKSSFSWLEKRRLIAVILGVIAGPIAYLSGQKFGVFMDIKPLGFILLGIFWGAIMWLLIKQLPSLPNHLQYKNE